MRFVPRDTLRDVVVRAFSEEEISHAKTLIFVASSDVEIRKKNRKNTVHKKKMLRVYIYVMRQTESKSIFHVLP